MAKNIITLTRGDSFDFMVNITDQNAPDKEIELEDGSIIYVEGAYEFVPNDVIHFRIMEPHQRFEDALIKKQYGEKDTDEDGNVGVSLEPKDTVNLDPGVYYYTVKIINEPNNSVVTVIPNTKLVLFD